MPTNLVVARARVAGGIELDTCAPDSIDAPAGDEILVKLPFRFDEMERRKEDYEVSLTTRLDEEPTQEDTFTGRDAAMRSDDRRGFVMTRHRIMLGGRHHLRFEARLRLTVGEWSGEGQEEIQETSCEGEVVIETR